MASIPSPKLWQGPSCLKVNRRLCSEHNNEASSLLIQAWWKTRKDNMSVQTQTNQHKALSQLKPCLLNWLEPPNGSPCVS